MQYTTTTTLTTTTLTNEESELNGLFLRIAKQIIAEDIETLDTHNSLRDALRAAYEAGRNAK